MKHVIFTFIPPSPHPQIIKIEYAKFMYISYTQLAQLTSFPSLFYYFKIIYNFRVR